MYKVFKYTPTQVTLPQTLLQPHGSSGGQGSPGCYPLPCQGRAVTVTSVSVATATTLQGAGKLQKMCVKEAKRKPEVTLGSPW